MFKALGLVALIFSMLIFASLGLSDEIAPGKALVIIDMQGVFTYRFGYDSYKHPVNQQKFVALLRAQLMAIEAAKKQNIPIILVEYAVGYKDHGKTAMSLREAVKNYKHAKTFYKSQDDMLSDFSEGKEALVKHLDKHKIGKLVIMGANGGFCIRRSIQGCLRTGKYQVFAYSSGIADFNHENFIYPYDNRLRKTLTYGMGAVSEAEVKLFKEVDSLKEIVELFAQRPTSVKKNKKIVDSSRQEEEKPEAAPVVRSEESKKGKST